MSSEILINRFLKNIRIHFRYADNCLELCDIDITRQLSRRWERRDTTICFLTDSGQIFFLKTGKLSLPE